MALKQYLCISIINKMSLTQFKLGISARVATLALIMVVLYLLPILAHA